MTVLKRALISIAFIFIYLPLLLNAQEAPKKSAKITEDTINQICNDAITKYFNEEKPKLLEENKKMIEEAIKASQEENKKILEELEKRILETADKNVETKAKSISEEIIKTKLEEYEKKQKEIERQRAIGGPGFIYDEDTVFRFYFDTLIRSEAYYNLTDYNSSVDDSEMRILQRSIFGGSVSYKNRLTATYKLRHTQIWGDQNLNIFTKTKDLSINIPSDTVINSIYKGNYGVGTYEASIEIGNFRDIPLTLEAGLLRLNYGDGRFLGSSNKWFIESEPSTAAVLKYNISGHQFHLIYSKIRESEVLNINGKLYKTPGDDLI